MVRIGRWSVILVSAIGYGFTLLTPVQIIEIGIFGLAGTFQLIVPTLGALCWKKSQGKAAIFGLLAGVFITLIGSLAMNMPTAYCAMIGLGANAAIFFIAGTILPSDLNTRKTIIENQNLFYRRRES